MIEVLDGILVRFEIRIIKRGTMWGVAGSKDSETLEGKVTMITTNTVTVRKKVIIVWLSNSLFIYI